MTAADRGRRATPRFRPILKPSSVTSALVLSDLIAKGPRVGTDGTHGRCRKSAAHESSLERLCARCSSSSEEHEQCRPKRALAWRGQEPWALAERCGLPTERRGIGGDGLARGLRCSEVGLVGVLVCAAVAVALSAFSGERRAGGRRGGSVRDCRKPLSGTSVRIGSWSGRRMPSGRSRARRP